MHLKTIKELLEICQEQVNIGNGDKKIMIPCDKDGNEFHGLYYDFTPAESIFTDINGEYDEYDLPNGMRGKKLKEFVVLG